MLKMTTFGELSQDSFLRCNLKIDACSKTHKETNKSGGLVEDTLMNVIIKNQSYVFKLGDNETGAIH